MAIATWKEQFSQFKDSQKSLSQVLLSGELSLADYMKWAAETHKIPFLNDNFFAQTNNHKLVLENPNAQWNEFFFPIHEWQGMLYVGCLEPQKMELNKKHCLVLCSPQQLSILWNKMQKPAMAAPAAPAPTPLAVPVSAPVTVTPTPVKPMPPTPVATKPATTPVASAPAAKPPVAPPTAPSAPQQATPTPPPLAVPVGAPATVSATTKPQAPATQQPVAPPVAKPATPAQPAAVKPAPAPVDPLAGLSKFSLEETKSEVGTHAQFNNTATKTELKAEPSVTQVAKEITQDKTVIPTSHLKQQGVNVNPNFKEDNYKIPEITNVVRATKPASNDTNFTSTKTIMPFPDRTTQFTFIRTVYSDQVIIDAKAKIQENHDPQDALISAFRILKDYYKGLMWIVRDQKGYAFPIACNTDWEFTEEAWNLSMDFKHPNPFRIAKLTQKPFHGPVSKNKASDQFFKQWGNGSYPEVMSIVPVKLHGKVFGYFVGCGKGPHFQNGQSLELMESVCKELIEAFIRIHKELNKAA